MREEQGEGLLGFRIAAAIILDTVFYDYHHMRRLG